MLKRIWARRPSNQRCHKQMPSSDEAVCLIKDDDVLLKRAEQVIAGIDASPVGLSILEASLDNATSCCGVVSDWDMGPVPAISSPQMVGGDNTPPTVEEDPFIQEDSDLPMHNASDVDLLETVSDEPSEQVDHVAPQSEPRHANHCGCVPGYMICDKHVSEMRKKMLATKR